MPRAGDRIRPPAFVGNLRRQWRAEMKWVAAAILAGAGIWAGATLAFYTKGTE
jgi:hypothetical protein